MKIKKNIGKIIRMKRILSNYTQREICDILKISKDKLSRIENCKYFSLSIGEGIKLSILFDLDINDIFSNENDLSILYKYFSDIKARRKLRIENYI